ncbi:hypothetical protein LZG04_14460 [Saccharothrix sp. S26]|uniref:hypothetical protein n=1 Tax=Saccharothrix sp. S26 TaxID=2907215 RepID=UPI001F27BB2C|nr:hypothetical protein [Saccharothrix sp. S26]MCE6995997.1 hypothetical protein [Saccharothrix sp. S26]
MTAAQEPQDDPIDPDELAEEAPIDPTPQEVDEYRSLIGDETPEPDEAVEHEEPTPEAGGRGPEIPEF